MGIKIDGKNIYGYLPGVGVNKGGTKGQALIKKSNEDYDTEWGIPDIPLATETEKGAVKSSTGTDKVVVAQDGTMSVTDVSLAEHSVTSDKVMNKLIIGKVSQKNTGFEYDGSEQKNILLENLSEAADTIDDFNDIIKSKIIAVGNTASSLNMPKSQVPYYESVNYGVMLSLCGGTSDVTSQLVFPYTQSKAFLRTARYTGRPTTEAVWHPWTEIITDLNSAINPNIAINYDFRNPVNQRQKTVYNSNGYCIDDWFFRLDKDNTSEATGTLTLEENGIHIKTTSNNMSSGFNQRIEFPSHYFNKTVTISIFIAENNSVGENDYFRFGLPCANSVNWDSDWSNGPYINIPINGTGLYTITGKFGSSTGNYSGQNIGLYFGTLRDMDIVISAIKVELGPRQTLCRRNSDGEWEICDIPDYGEQLAKCQRYFQNLNLYSSLYAYYGDGPAKNSTQILAVVPTPVTLRVKPSISFSGNIQLYSSSIFKVTNITIDRISANCVSLQATVESGLTVGNSYHLVSFNDSSSYIYLNANL